METFLITQEQIMSIEKGELTIREVFPKLFIKELVRGGIYEVNGMIIRYAGKLSRNYDSGAYGFTACGEFKENLGLGEDDTFNEVDMKDWEEMLLGEARKRGFVEGAKYSNDRKIYTIQGKINAHYMSGTNSTKLTDGYGGSIFNHGVWEDLAISLKEAQEKLGVKIIY
jgi:hypothetical protein